MPNMKKMGKKVGRALKKAAKKAAANPEVRSLAKQLAGQLKAEAKMAASSLILGSGDYKVGGPVVGRGTRFPGSTRKMRVVRKEFVTPVVSSATAKGTEILKFRVNPGAYSSGFWTSSLARGFQSWRPVQCRLVYEPTSGLAVASDDTSLGKVILAAQYNSYARDWDSIAEFQNARDSVTTDPATGATLLLECARSKRGADLLYVSAQDPVTAGKAFYDLCDVFCCITGLRGTSVRAGDLYFEWTIDLEDPILRDSEMPSAVYAVTAVVASANDPFAADGVGTVTETISTTLGTGLAGAVVATNTTLTVKMKPVPGKTRVRITWQKVGANVARTAPATCTVVSSYLGNTVDSSVPDNTEFAGGIPFIAGVSLTGTAVLSWGNYLLSPNVDKFVITFGSATGNAGDTVKCIVVVEPAEGSDF